MNLSVLLVSSPSTLVERYGVLAAAGSTQPSFGLACLAAVVEELGVKVLVVDAAAENLSVEKAFSEITRLRPRVVGISATTSGIVAAGKLGAKLKSFDHDIITIIGGCHVTALPAETLREFPSLDIAVIGEGEKTLVALLDYLSSDGTLPQNMPGTAVRDGDSVRVNPRPPLIGSLDELPLPAWSRVRNFPGIFRPSPSRARRHPSASVVLTRGCPNKCYFCDRSVFGNRCRSYSPAYSVRMLEDLVNNYGVKEVMVEDDTFIVSKKWGIEFCERLINSSIDLSWSCLGRADRVSPEILSLIRRAGCWHISYGIESGDASILEAMGKNLEIAQIEQAVRWSRAVGLRVKGFFMVGFPGESENSLKATCALAKRLQLDDISVMQLTPFPGTELYAKAGQTGTMSGHWDMMTTLNTVFVPNGLTKESLEVARARMLREFYLRPHIIGRKFFQTLSSPRASWDMIRALVALIRLLIERVGVSLNHMLRK